MSKEVVDLNPAVITKLQTVLEQISPTRVSQFQDLADSITALTEKSNSLTEQRVATLCPLEEEFNYQTAWQEDILRRRDIVEDFIYNPRFKRAKGCLNVIRGLKLVKAGVLAEHPLLSPLTEEQNMAENQLKQAEEELQRTTTRVERQFDPDINSTQRSLVETKGRLINLVESQVIQDNDAPINYLPIMPQRGENLAEKYADRFARSYERVPNFSEFEKEVRREYLNRAHSPISRFLQSNPNIQEVPFEKLPIELQYNLKRWVAERILKQWQDQTPLNSF